MRELPIELQYVERIAHRYCDDDLIVSTKQREFVSRLSDEDLSTLRDIYTEIIRRNHGTLIITGIQNATPDEIKHSKWRCVFRLAILLHKLEEFGVPGFSDVSKIFDIKPNEIQFDWSSLPAKFHYLIPAAERFGAISSDAAIDSFLCNASRKELALLHAAADEVQLRGHFEQLITWTIEESKNWVTETTHMYALLGLIDAIDQ